MKPQLFEELGRAVDRGAVNRGLALSRQGQECTAVQMGGGFLDDGNDGAPLRGEPNAIREKLVEKSSSLHARGREGSTILLQLNRN